MIEFSPDASEIGFFGRSWRNFSICFFLAWKSLKAEKMFALCVMAGVASALFPLLLLAGFKAGIVENMRHQIMERPLARQMMSARNMAYDEKLLQDLRANPKIAFLLPKTRTLSAMVRLQNVDEISDFRGVDVELLPTASGDPLPGKKAVEAWHNAIENKEESAVIFSARLAAYLHADVGDHFVINISRQANALHQKYQKKILVASIAERDATSRFQLFAPLSLTQAVEEWRENPSLSTWESAEKVGQEKADSFFQGKANVSAWAGFRLYVKDIADIVVLDKKFSEQGIQVVSEVGQVETLLQTNKGISILFILMALVGGGGMVITLGASAAAITLRLQHKLAALSFLGVENVSWLPVFQAEFMAVAGVFIAELLSWSFRPMINLIWERFFHETSLSCDGSIVAINYGTDVAILIAAALLAAVAAIFASHQIKKVSPWSGICAD